MNNTFKMDGALMLCNSLIKWLQSLEIPGPQKNEFEISDGVAVAQALTQISPEYFTPAWNSKIKSDVASNWRLKVSNLKKIVEGVIEYYQDILNLNVLDSARPDVLKIGESADPMELGKLLQLVLGCAVNCDKKQEYITRIMAMEESVQQSIMQAIQSLDEATRGRGPFSISFEAADSTRIHRLNADLDVANEARELLAQRCHDLELQVECLSEEKISMQTENQRLQNRLEEMSGNLIGPTDVTPSRTTELRRQVEMLKEDLYKMETSKDDYRLKAMSYEKQLGTMQNRIEELQMAAERATQLKDEVDALTETADKVQTMEMTLTSYKKKLEEYADLKKQVKILEDKNNEYYQQNMSYEEEMKKSSMWKSQIEFYKKQSADLNQKLDEEIAKVDKAEFENKKLETKLLAVQREREAVIAEREALREANEELRCGAHQSSDGVGDVARELAAPQLRERIAVLEKEIRSLRSASSTNADPAAAAALLEDASQRQDQLRAQLRTSNQRVLELEAKLEDSNAGDGLKQKCTSLQDALNAKDVELQAVKEKSKKSLDKAREIIRTMQPRASTEDVIAQLERTTNHNGVMKEAEARLLTTAFLNLGETCQREAVDARLALLSAGQGATFLSRQRQPTSRRSLQSYKLN